MSNIKTFTNDDEIVRFYTPLMPDPTIFENKVRLIGTYDFNSVAEIKADKPCIIIVLSTVQLNQYSRGDLLHGHFHRITNYENINNYEIINTPTEMEYEKIVSMPFSSYSYSAMPDAFYSNFHGQKIDIQKIEEISSRVCNKILEGYTKQTSQKAMPYHILMFAKEVPNMLKTEKDGIFWLDKNKHSPFDIKYTINLYGDLVSNSK